MKCIVVKNAYDDRSRQIQKIADGKMTTFRYDDWNMIRETANGEATYSIWRLDLSGTLQGAGGVGGLLARYGASGWQAYAYDANGNVTDGVDSQGDIVAHYEYDAFGNPIAPSGDPADANPYRFSTKYLDETGLYYYGYRFYSPAMGRWLNRDPIEERGGLNLYGFVGNNSIESIDLLGLLTLKVIVGVDLRDLQGAGSRQWVSGYVRPIVDHGLLNAWVADAKREFRKLNNRDCGISIQFALSSQSNPMSNGRLQQELGSGADSYVMIFHGFPSGEETGIALYTEMWNGYESQGWAKGKLYRLGDVITSDVDFKEDANVNLSCCFLRGIPDKINKTKIHKIGPNKNRPIAVYEIVTPFKALISSLCCEDAGVGQ